MLLSARFEVYKIVGQISRLLVVSEGVRQTETVTECEREKGVKCKPCESGVSCEGVEAKLN